MENPPPSSTEPPISEEAPEATTNNPTGGGNGSPGELPPAGVPPDPAKEIKVEQPKTDQCKLDERKEELDQSLSSLASEVLVADEWGIFKSGGSKEKPAIYGQLTRASNALEAGKFDDAEAEILNGWEMLNNAQNANWVWRMNNRFGILPIFFTAMSAVLTYLFVFRIWLDLDRMSVIHHAAFAGMVGAVLRSLYWLQFQTGKGLLRPRWFTTFIVAPPIGTILGGLIYLLIKASVQAVSKDIVNTDWPTISLLAAFAGFKWEWALEILEEAAKSVQARIKEKTPAKANS